MVLSLLSGAIGGAASFLGGRKANKSAEKSVAKQLAFQKESAQNSYQWATEDMKKAGINPMLAYQQGGSSALSGANYTPQNAAAAGVSSALNAAAATENVKNLQAQNQKIHSDVQLNKALEVSAGADAALKASTAQNVRTQTQLISRDLSRAKVQTAADKTLVGKGTTYIGRWLENLGIKNPSRRTISR
jgi:hypothetical protein